LIAASQSESHASSSTLTTRVLVGGMIHAATSASGAPLVQLGQGVGVLVAAILRSVSKRSKRGLVNKLSNTSAVSVQCATDQALCLCYRWNLTT